MYIENIASSLKFVQTRHKRYYKVHRRCSLADAGRKCSQAIAMTCMQDLVGWRLRYDIITPMLQLSEDLEQLKVIEHGYRIKVVMVDHCAHGVDTPADVDSIIATMRENNWH